VADRPHAPEAVTAPDEQIVRLWELCYLDPAAAHTLAITLTGTGGVKGATAWLHIGLYNARFGDTNACNQAVAQARAAFDTLLIANDAAGLAARASAQALCDEVAGIALRRAGDFEASAQLQAQVDARDGVVRDAMHHFIAHNSRAITAKLQGRTDAALRHVYAAKQAAKDTGWAGPRITALSNLGGYQHDLFNLDDARVHSEQALALAREAGVRQVVTIAGINLVVIYYAAGEAQQARAMVEFLVSHPQEQSPGMLDRFKVNLALGHLCVGEIDAALAYLQSSADAGIGDGDGLATWTWVMGRCLLARNDAAGARALLEYFFEARQRAARQDLPFDSMELNRVLADACEQLGDAQAALRCLRQAHTLHEQLVGRSARARFIALEISHELEQAQRERDAAVASKHDAESDRHRLAELNTALQLKIDETAMLHAQLSEQALRDPLTGLHNRRYLFEVAPGMLELARRQNSPLCVVLLDLDHFKLLNDTFGHAAGDQVLQRFAKLLSEMLRRSDVVSRHGGEEFVAVMPDIDAEGAQAKIEQLLLAFQAPQPEAGRRRLPRGSFSAGIAVFPKHGNTLEQLLLRADRGLYSAKHQGRARVELAPKTGFGSLS
jgi:diguanylate cyclase (GGDEF)-like protein